MLLGRGSAVSAGEQQHGARTEADGDQRDGAYGDEQDLVTMRDLPGRHGVTCYALRTVQQPNHWGPVKFPYTVIGSTPVMLQRASSNRSLAPV